MKIGIIGAMESEVELLKQRISQPSVRSISGLDYFEGTLEGVPVVVVRSGVGKVNAAMCMQTLACAFDITHVINTGVAGAIDPSLEVGDMVVSVDTVQYDFDVHVFGYEPGEIASLGKRFFEADPMLVRKATEAIRAAGIPCVEGRVSSGDQFICNPEAKAALRETFSASCCEMEGAAIGQVAWINKIPFVVVRSISDKADGSDVIDYPEFELKSAERSAALVAEMLKTLR